jgi:hypothetical protein
MTISTPSRDSTAEHGRLAQARDARRTISPSRSLGMSGDLISPSARGARYARTTATTVMPGASFLMIMRGPGRTAGMNMVWPVRSRH